MKQLLLSIMLGVGTVWGQSHDPFSPVVTRQVSETIQKALASAEQNPNEGIAVLLAIDPEKSGAAVDFTLGNLYFQTENYAEAQKMYVRALKKFPDFRDAKINLGRTYFLLERPEDAVQVYQKLARDGIADAETYVLLGHGFMMEGFAVSAETAYRQALLLDEKGVGAREGLLNTLWAQQRNEEVLALSNELLKVQPGNRSFWMAKANAGLSMEDFQGAARSLEQARRLGIADAEMLSMLGQLYLQEDIQEEAVVRFEEAFALGELSPLRQEQAIRGLLQLERLPEAESLMEKMGTQLKFSSESDRRATEGTFLKLKVRLYVMQDRIPEAEELIQKGLEEGPMDGELLLLQAELLREQAQREEAVLVLERLARLPGFEAQALLQLAQIEVDRAQWASAAALLERAQVFEEKAELGDYLQQLRRMAEAEAEADGG